MIPFNLNWVVKFVHVLGGWVKERVNPDMDMQRLELPRTDIGTPNSSRQKAGSPPRYCISSINHHLGKKSQLVCKIVGSGLYLC
jgi:hypothetical protein